MAAQKHLTRFLYSHRIIHQGQLASDKNRIQIRGVWHYEPQGPLPYSILYNEFVFVCWHDGPQRNGKKTLSMQGEFCYNHAVYGEHGTLQFHSIGNGCYQLKGVGTNEFGKFVLNGRFQRGDSKITIIRQYFAAVNCNQVSTTSQFARERPSVISHHPPFISEFDVNKARFSVPHPYRNPNSSQKVKVVQTQEHTKRKHISSRVGVSPQKSKKTKALEAEMMNSAGEKKGGNAPTDPTRTKNRTEKGTIGADPSSTVNTEPTRPDSDDESEEDWTQFFREQQLRNEEDSDTDTDDIIL